MDQINPILNKIRGVALNKLPEFDEAVRRFLD